MIPTSRNCQPAILHLVHSLDGGGTERNLARLVRGLPDTDQRHLVCALRDCPPDQRQLFDGLPTVELGTRGRSRLACWRLAAVARRERVTLIHARNTGVWSDAVLAGWLLGSVPVVLGYHGLEGAGHFTRRHRHKARLLGMRRHLATTVSQAGRRQLVEELGFAPGQVVTLPNGVDTGRFRPVTPDARERSRAGLAIQPDQFAVGCVANMNDPVKGHDVLLDAWRAVQGAVPRARLLLVGDGNLRAALADRARALGIADSVTWLGRCERVDTILAALDAYVCPSRAEGSSNALLEALATGLPATVTDVSDHRVMFNAIQPALVVPIENAAALAERLIQLDRAPAQRQAWGRAGRAWVCRRHGAAAMVTAYARFYAGHAGRLARTAGGVAAAAG